MKRRFEVCSIHLFRECNLNCSFCYREKDSFQKEKTLSFWMELIPHLKAIGIDQIATGGGEPLMRPRWIELLSFVCKNENIIFNFTTNGKLIKKVPLETFQDTTMISISFDDEKIKNKEDFNEFISNILYLKENFPNLKIGINYLCTEKGLKNLIPLTQYFFEILEIDRIFALCPKNFTTEILNYRNEYLHLTMIYKNFYVDDLTKSIIQNDSYNNWKTPCHFGKVLSIDETGEIGGCSFDLGKIKTLKLEKPKDILKIKNIEFKERFSCPYLKV